MEQVEYGRRVVQVRQERVGRRAETSGPVGEDFVPVEIIGAVGAEDDPDLEQEGEGAGSKDRDAGRFQVTSLALVGIGGRRCDYARTRERRTGRIRKTRPIPSRTTACGSGVGWMSLPDVTEISLDID